ARTLLPSRARVLQPPVQAAGSPAPPTRRRPLLHHVVVTEDLFVGSLVPDRQTGVIGADSQQPIGQSRCALAALLTIELGFQSLYDDDGDRFATPAGKFASEPVSLLAFN